METLHFTTDIDAPADVVWTTMLDDSSYRIWAGVFNPGSYFEGDWSPGSEIRFLGTGDDDDSTGGMLGVIVEHWPREFVSIEYTGLVMDGVTDTTSDEARLWTGSHENYTFTEADGVTTVTVDIDVDELYADMFREIWPRSLEKLKELAESEAALRAVE